MRKNAVNKKLRVIEGGVCAPQGFYAGGVHSGISRNPEKKDMALILSERRCSTACVFSTDAGRSVTARLSEKHLKNGLASAFLINSGVANLFLPEGNIIALKACRFLATKAKTDANDTVIASTGKIGGDLSLSHFERGIPLLLKQLSCDETGSFAAAEAIMTTDKTPRHLSYEFDLGNFSCKIGAIFKGSARVCPNMATTLAFLTTDVNITPEMLQKALSAAVRDTFNLLSIDGVSSPNDTVGIMANGRAGNYKISCMDTEYSKFLYALKEVLAEICRRIAEGGDEKNRLFSCKVQGASSKAVARDIAKGIINSQNFKNALLQGKMDVEGILYIVNSATELLDFEKIQVQLVGECAYSLFDAGCSIEHRQETLLNMLQSEEIKLFIDLSAGNYAATAFGSLQPNKK